MNFKLLLIIMLLILMAFISFVKEAFSQSTSFEKQLVCNEFTQGTEVFACDINQDSLMDFITTGNTGGGQVAWWENNGYHEFIKHVVDAELDWARSVCAGDLNDDGEIDIVVAAYGGDMIRWYENDGNENWSKHFVDNNFTGAHTVDIKDVNDDGRPDVLCSSFDNSSAYSEIAWFENLADTNWTKHVISTRFQQSPFIYGEDIDGDNDLDILACGELNGEVYWWENDGNQSWTEHMIDNQFSMAHTVFARDIDLDGDFDIIGAACMSSKIAWWENDGSQNFTKHPMGTLAGALWFDAVDLDNDGDRDLYGGGQGASKLVWWENDGSQNFSKHYFEDNFTQTFSVVHADLNNDSDTDLVAIGFSSNQISWFDNQQLNPNLYNKPECVVYDETNDRYLVSNPGGGFVLETDTANNQSYFIHGYDIPCGMCLVDEVLYASDGDTLFGWDITTGEEVMALNLNAYNNLDGITTDGNGYLYVVDTWGRIIKVNLADETFDDLVSSGLPEWPQDCVYDPFNDRIIVAAFKASAPIVSVDPETGDTATLTTNSVGRYDGVTIDQYGNFYFSTFVGGGRVHKYPNDFSDYTAIAYGLGEPTGLNYNQQDNILAVPSFNQHTVHFFHIDQTGFNEIQAPKEIEFYIYPNPCNGKARLIINGNEENESYHFNIHNQNGQLLQSRYMILSGEYTMELDLGALDAGIYYTSLSNGAQSSTRKLVIR
ncbi:MAG: FG-GAP-like repeat-containing protein [Bacteroidota bacterium]